MKQIIQPGATIGIIGGGQLGRMMAIAAKQMGYKIAVLEPTPHSPCGQVADIEIEAAYDDREGAKKLAEVADVITYEFENIDDETAEWLTKKSDFPQGADVLRVTQHRLIEKRTLERIGVPVAPFYPIEHQDAIEPAIETIGFPAVLKTCRGGYDGKGQRVVKTKEQLIEAAAELLAHGDCVLEAWVPFSKEISVIATRSRHGEIAVFPIAENEHRNNILFRTSVPARVSNDVAKRATAIAEKIVNDLNVVGTLAVEMFLLEDGTIYVNELAPRPHNSGHYTIEACETSQFEQHIRAVCGLPLGPTTLRSAVVMENILGEQLEGVLASLARLSDVKLHLYGKAEARPKRKMGHLTAIGQTVEEAQEKLDRFMKRK